MTVEGGEGVVLRELDERFPDKLAVTEWAKTRERLLVKHGATEACTGRARLLFTRASVWSVCERER